MSVAASFFVAEIIKNNTPYIRVKLLPTMRENLQTGLDHSKINSVNWSKYTPSGEIWMNVSTETGAAQFFEDNLGVDVPITFG